jgi:hypothetical protein
MLGATMIAPTINQPLRFTAPQETLLCQVGSCPIDSNCAGVSYEVSDFIVLGGSAAGAFAVRVPGGGGGRGAGLGRAADRA